MRKILLSLLVLIIVVIGFAPTLFSTSWGNQILFSTVKGLQAESLKLSWFGPQEAKQVRYKDGSASLVIFDGSLFTLLREKTAWFKAGGTIQNGRYGALTNINVEVRQEKFKASGKAGTGNFSATGSWDETLQVHLHDLQLPADNPLGTNVSGDLQGDFAQNTITGNLTSTRLQIPHFSIHVGKDYSLTDPVTFTYKLAEEAQPLKGELHSLSLPLSLKVEKSSLDLSFSCPKFKSLKNIEGTLKGEKSKKLQLTGHYFNSSFDITSALNFNARALTLQKPLNINWNLTPKAFAQLAKLPNLRLTQRENITGEISPFTYSFAEGVATAARFSFSADKLLFQQSQYIAQNSSLKGNLTPTGFQGDLLIKSLSFKEVNLRNLTASLQRDEENLSFALNTRVGKGNISAQGKIADAISIKAQMSDVPTALFDTILQITGRPPLFAALGESMDGNLVTELQNKNGPFDLTLTSKSFSTTVEGDVQNGNLTLRAPFKAQLIPSPALAQVLYKNFDVQLLGASQPITLQIATEGFSLPLVPANVARFNAGYGRVDVGQIVVADIGVTSSVGGLVKMGSSDGIHLWFAPMEFRIQNGIMQIERTEILFQKSLQLATWGRIDLPKRYVRMILGLTAQSLSLALGIDNLPSDYVLQIPFRGPIGNVQLDSGAAAAKIAWLITRKQALPQIGGVWGDIVGSLGDLAEPDSPPPKRPFPWET